MMNNTNHIIIKEIINDVTEYADSLNVDIKLKYQKNKSYIWISSIKRRKNGIKGSGQLVLNKLIEDAENEGITLKGIITPPSPALEQYYAQMGFDLYYGKNNNINIKME